MRGTMHHIDLTVRDPDASKPFYDAVLGFAGYRHGLGGDVRREEADEAGPALVVVVVELDAVACGTRRDRLHPRQRRDQSADRSTAGCGPIEKKRALGGSILRRSAFS